MRSILHTVENLSYSRKQKEAPSCCDIKDPLQSSMSLQLSATRVHSEPAHGLQPFPLHLPTYRLVRWLPQSAFDRVICFSSAVHVFVLCQLQKTHFSLFSLSPFPLPPSSLSVSRQRRKGMWIQSKSRAATSSYDSPHFWAD